MINVFLALKRACHRLSECATAEAQARTGYFGAQALALITLEAKGSCKLTELAEEVDAGRSATTTLVQRMEANDLVIIKPHKSDSRALTLTLTEKGHDAADEVKKMIGDFNAELLHGFNLEEKQVIYRFIQQVLNFQGSFKGNKQ